MDFLSNLYSKAVYENEKNLRFWEDYLKSLKELDFKKFSEKLTVPVLVPIGSRILFRGEIKHTNEILASIGADYFAKCSIAQAEILREHRMKDGQSKVDMYRKGREYLENQLSFRKENLYDNSGQDIVEFYSEDEDKAWRIKHRENVRQHKIKYKDVRENIDKNKEGITDEELWNRLEELELQEELENELVTDSRQDDSQNDELIDSFIVREDYATPTNKEKHKDPILNEERDDKEVKTTKDQETARNVRELTEMSQVSNYDLLQKVIDRQNELDERLQELKNKERPEIKTEKDLMAMLDEMEQLDELEDEMNRLDDIIEGEDVDSDKGDDSTESRSSVVKRSVSFADEDDSETIDITFKHSDVLPSSEIYDPNRGIQKPCDIYSAFSNLFNETTSILKKTKYSSNVTNTDLQADSRNKDLPKVTFMDTENHDDDNVSKTIVVKDVVEKVNQNENLIDSVESRPTSIFKKKRMQKK